MPDPTPRGDKEITTAESAWLRDFFKYETEELLTTDPKANAAAENLLSSLGGSPPSDNVTGWLQSEPVAVEVAAVKVVQESEQNVASLSTEEPVGVSTGEAELPEEEEVGEEAELDEEDAYYMEHSDGELDTMIGLYDKLLGLVDRLGEGAELTADDMEMLLAAAEAEVITLTFEDDTVNFEGSTDGDIALESSVVEG